jgi:hypothetical protein
MHIPASDPRRAQMEFEELKATVRPCRVEFHGALQLAHGGIGLAKLKVRSATGATKLPYRR